MKCKRAVTSMVDQVILLLDQIPDVDFSRQLDVYEEATLGKHFRHIYEFFDCLFCQCSSGTIDYSKRKRDQSLEESTLLMKEGFQSLLLRLSSIDEDIELNVCTDFLNDDLSRHQVSTSLGRELMYAYDHAVHHLAIVRIGLASLHPKIEFDPNLGIAASTVQHQYRLSHGHS